MLPLIHKKDSNTIMKKKETSFWFLVVSALSYLKTRASSGELKWDLGAKQLLPTWKAFFATRFLKEDVKAGILVGATAIPLSLAIGLGSKVEPGLGLVSAIVAGVVCAFFGGSRLIIRGPANSMLVIMAVIIERTGLSGLAFVGLICGVTQILFGMFGLGRFVRYVPLPLIAGFTAGIGVIIFVGQLPRALGLPVPADGDVLSVITHLRGLLHESQPQVLLLALITTVSALSLRKFYPKLPASFLSLLLTTLLTIGADWDVPTLGMILENGVVFQLPGFPASKFIEIFEMSFLLFMLMFFETRLSSLAVDRLVPGEKYDADQEMVGQGLGNCLLACLGALPVTGVIARSTLNIRAEAQSRRSSVVHSFFIVGVLLFARPLLARIPIAALSGVLLSISIGMISPREIIKIWKTSPVETLIYWITLVTIVLVDLMAGVQLGIFAALLIAIWNLGQAKVFFHKTEGTEALRVSLTGNVTFMASRNFELLSKRVSRAQGLKALIIDMADVRLIDSTGASMLLEFMKEMREKDVKVVLKSLNREAREVVGSVDSEKLAGDTHVTSESEIAEVLREKKSYSPRARLLFGVERYRGERKKAYEELFDQLGGQQKPHTLFITCSDSRINPTLITSSEPGELFIVRNVGNIVPTLEDDDTPAEGAALEFSLGALGVEEIVICGHTRCGAIKGVFQGIDPNLFPSVAKWVAPIAVEREKYPEIQDPEDFVKVHVIEQARNALSYPIVRKKINEGQVRIHCWIYDVVKGDFFEWTGKGVEFVPVGPQSLHGNIQTLLSPSQSDY